jgi:hypothetical protein
LAYFNGQLVILYTSPFGMLYLDKSGNPGSRLHKFNFFWHLCRHLEKAWSA